MNRCEYHRSGRHQLWNRQNSDWRRMLRFELLESRFLLSAVPAELQLQSRVPIQLENFVSNQSLESVQTSAEMKSSGGLDSAAQQVLSVAIDWGDGTSESEFAIVSDMVSDGVFRGSLTASHIYAKSGPFRVEPGRHDVTVVARDDGDTRSSITTSVLVRDNYTPVRFDTDVVLVARNDRRRIEFNSNLSAPWVLSGRRALDVVEADPVSHLTVSRPPIAAGPIRFASGASMQAPNRPIPANTTHAASRSAELLSLVSDIRLERAFTSAHRSAGGSLHFANEQDASEEGNLDELSMDDALNHHDSRVNEAMFAQFGSDLDAGWERIKADKPGESQVPAPNTVPENAKSTNEMDTPGKGKHSDSGEQQPPKSDGESGQATSTKVSYFDVRPSQATIDEILNAPPHWNRSATLEISRRAPPVLVQPDDPAASEMNRG